MKAIAWLVGVAAFLGSGGYLLTYIIRWQWNRALFSGMALLAVLLVMGFAAVSRRLSQLEQAVRAQEDHDQGAAAAFAADLAATRPRRDHFGWLQELPQQHNVFITILLGGGALISAVGWLVGRIAEQTTTPRAEHGLAERLAPIAFPADGLVPSDDPGAGPASRLLRAPQGAGR